jgi:ribosomal protein S8
MKYIISESKLEKLVLKFLEEKRFVDDAKIEDGEVIIYLKYPIPNSDEIRELADLIKTMFNYHGQIYKPSNPRWTYKMVHNF